MNISLERKKLLVTGSTQGLGLCVAELAVECGVAAVVITGRNAARGQEIVRRLSTSKTQIIFAQADLAAPDAPATIMNACEQIGGVDLLVNSAGLTDRAGFIDGTPEAWDKLFGVNAKAAFFIMQPFINSLIRRGVPGSIVNILSMNAHCGTPELAIYSATKGALTTLTKNAANSFLDKLIRVNGINMGWAPTDGEIDMQGVTLGKGESWVTEAAKKMPLKRMLMPIEVARTAIFLLSDFSVPMTGVDIDLEQWIVGAPPR